MKLILFHPRAENFKKQLNDYEIDYETNFENLKQNINKYEGLLAFGLDKSIDLSNLKWIQSLAAGVDWIINNPTLDEKTIITRVTEGLERLLFEYTLSKIMYFYQNTDFHLKNQRDKVWDRLFSGSIVNKNVLVVGTGKIGTYIGQQLNQLGMKIYGVNTSGYQLDKFEKCFTFNEIDKNIKYDVVVNVLPATKDTNQIFNDKFFNNYQIDLFINIGRGSAVAVESLIEKLETNQIKMAVLDVFEVEPLDMNSALWEIKNLHITPHIAGILNISNTVKIIKKNLDKILSNQNLEDIVNIKKGY